VFTPSDFRVAIITPYYDEELEQIQKCNQSVLSQSYQATHVLVADGRPHPNVSALDAQHVILPLGHSDIGSTPRLIGAYHAIGLGYDAIGFLDADNWLASNHVEMLVEAHYDSRAAFLSSGRWLCHLDGTPMAVCPYTDPAKFIDTNCMFFTRDAFKLLHHWVLMPEYGHLIGDRIILYHVRKSGLKMVHVNAPSVYYRCSKEGVYRNLGRDIPDGISPRPDYESSFRRWIADGNEPL
jgi:glycosyltransferase involved in cell wall biosynthesis